MVSNPIQEGALKTDVPPGLFAFTGFMPQDLVALG
jgi:hypothetical protein